MIDNAAEESRYAVKAVEKAELVAAMKCDHGWQRRVPGYMWSPFMFGYVRRDGVFVPYMAFFYAFYNALPQWRHSLDDMRTHTQVAADVLDTLAEQSTERVEVTE